MMAGSALVSVPSASAQQSPPPYSDVDAGGVHRPAIKQLSDAGIFEGSLCGDDKFCPTSAIQRSTMAVWLIRALALTDPPQVQDSKFADVKSGQWWVGHVELLSQLGITAGCSVSPLRYCPDESVTRAEMATFLARAFNLDLAGARSAGFTDVVQSSVHAPGINALAAAGITAGCSVSPLRYCPDESVTRAEMATFLARAYVAPINLTGTTPLIEVQINKRTPTIGETVEIVATVTSDAAAPLPGARLELHIDGELRDIAVADSNGRAVFFLNSPTGPLNQGGYDSLRVQVAGTETSSLPSGVFWQAAESRRITISASPDTPNTGGARTITARLFDGTDPLANQAVELHIDGTVAGRATTSGSGIASFTHRRPVHGPFDLARVVLAKAPDVVSNEIIISWPMTTGAADRNNHWQLVWNDEFDGESLDSSKWKAADNCPPVYLSCETSRPENVYVSDGMLHLRSLREPYSGTNNWSGRGQQVGPLAGFTPGRFQVKDFTAGRVDSQASFTYGRFELLGKLPGGHGTFYAFWMKPPNSPYGVGHSAGEIDIAEGANIGKGGVDAQLPGPGWGVHHVVHMGVPHKSSVKLTNLSVDPSDSFHLYAVEWDTSSIRFYIDDQRFLTVPRSEWFSRLPGEKEPVNNPYAPFDSPFSIIISNLIGNWALETWPGQQVPDTTIFPAEFVVDYVRVYECRAPEAQNLGPGQGCESRKS